MQVRTEQFFIYTLLMVLALNHKKIISTTIKNSQAKFFLSLVLLITPAIIGSIVHLANSSKNLDFENPYRNSFTGSALAALDNYTLPVAALLAFHLLATRLVNVFDLTKLFKLLNIFVFFNVLVSILAYLGYISNSYFQLFWSPTSESSSMSVALLAIQNARYSGIFNQPAEAGILYLISMLASCYLYAKKEYKLWLSSFFLLVSLVGGAISGSKITLFIGAAASIGFMIINKNLKLLVVTLISACTMFFFTSGLFGIGSTQYSSAISLQGNLLYLLTSGRWGQAGTQTTLVYQVLEFSPLFGLGLSNFGSNADSEVLRLLGTSGFFGLLAFVSGQFLLYQIIRVNISNLPVEKRLFVILYFSIIAGSFGLPVLSANKVGTILCLILIGFLHIQKDIDGPKKLSE
jgi:hypothetical protein